MWWQKWGEIPIALQGITFNPLSKIFTWRPNYSYFEITSIVNKVFARQALKQQHHLAHEWRCGSTLSTLVFYFIYILSSSLQDLVFNRVNWFAKIMMELWKEPNNHICDQDGMSSGRYTVKRLHKSALNLVINHEIAAVQCNFPLKRRLGMRLAPFVSLNSLELPHTKCPTMQ